MKQILFFFVGSLVAVYCMLLLPNVAFAQTWYRQYGGSAIQSSKTYTSSVMDSPGVYITSTGTYNLSNSQIVTSGNSSIVDSSSRSGLNAGILVNFNSLVTLNDDTISTSGIGANGLFSTGSGSIVTISNSVINTTGVHAHAVDVTYGGTVNLINAYVTSTNDTAPAIATDCAGGSINFEHGTATAAGHLSSGVYSTGSIIVSNSTITATADHGAVIDVNGILSMTNTTLIGAQSGLMVHNTTGALVTGFATFTGGSITAEGGHVIFDTAANLTVSLNAGTTVNSSTGNLLYAVSSSVLNCTMNAETVTGNIYADSSSTTVAILQSNTTLNSTIMNASLDIDASSQWILTGNSHIEVLTDVSGVNTTTLTVNNITGNGYNVYYNASLADNAWLSNKNYSLSGGGCLLPEGATCVATEVASIINNNNDLDIYPNPAYDVVSITYSATNDNSTFSILGMDGRIVLTGKLQKGLKEHSIDLSGINSGIYLLVVDSNSGRQVKRFSKI